MFVIYYRITRPGHFVTSGLKETIGKIEDLETDIKVMKEKIADAKKNIKHRQGRMSVVDKSIEEIQQNITEVKKIAGWRI